MLLIKGVITYIFQNYILENEAMLYGLKLISSSLNIWLGIIFCFISNVISIFIYNKHDKNSIMEELND